MKKMGTMKSGLGVLLAIVLGLGLAACSSSDDPAVDQRSTGTLEFYANGERHIREGIRSQDGWEMVFDHFFVNLSGPTAIQGEVDDGAQTSSVQSALGGSHIQHAGHPHTGIATGTVHAALVGDYLVDLQKSPLAPDEERTLVGSVSHVDGLGNRVYTGNYNTLNFGLEPVEIAGGSYTGTCPAMDSAECEAAALAMQGHSLRMTGTATCVDADQCTKDEVVGFDIHLLSSGLAWSLCVWEPDDGDPENPGLVLPNETGWVEMTFHLDHVFGNLRKEEPSDFALGFAPFRSIIDSEECMPEDLCSISADESELRAAWANEDLQEQHPELRYAYGILIYSMAGMGHSGEGHCLH